MSSQNKTEYFFFSAFVKLFSLLGINKARKFAHFLAFLFYYIIPLRKETVISNLKRAFPDLSDKEIRKLAYRNYYSVAVTLIEIMCLPYMKPEQVKNCLHVPDVEKIREKFLLNRGVLLMTAHFGNWELGACSVGLHLGVPIYVVAKPQRNTFVSSWLTMMRESFGNKVVLLGMSIRNIFKVLYDKQIVGVVGDQRGNPEDPRVKFMGIDSSVYPGTAVMALRTKSPIVVVITERQKDFTYHLKTGFIEVENLEGTEEEKIIAINQQYCAILEESIRKYPEQWFWMHKRWKY